MVVNALKYMCLWIFPQNFKEIFSLDCFFRFCIKNNFQFEKKNVNSFSVLKFGSEEQASLQKYVYDEDKMGGHIF